MRTSRGRALARWAARRCNRDPGQAAVACRYAGERTAIINIAVWPPYIPGALSGEESESANKPLIGKACRTVDRPSVPQQTRCYAPAGGLMVVRGHERDMRTLIEQVRQAADSRAYYLSLFASLTLPDICAAMSASDGQTNRSRYIAWFDQYVAPMYTVGPARIPSFGGADCYYYRCSMLHQGSSQHPRSSYSRILFVEPGSTTNVFHNNLLNDALNLDVGIFCRDVCNGADQWLAEVEQTPEYQTNYGRFMQRHPNGLPPYIVGVPVIA